MKLSVINPALDQHLNSFLDVKKNEDIIKEIELDQKFKYLDLIPENEQVLITINDKNVLSSRNMLMISGLPKSQKSTVSLFFFFSFISGVSINGFSVKKNEGYKALYIDTELSNLSFYKLFNRVKTMSNINQIDYECFNVYLFRMLDKKEIINNIIFLLEKNEEYKYLFIDGLLDLCDNFNDPEETRNLVLMMQQICEKRDVSLITVLHLNKTNSYSMGHLGSSMERKAESCITCHKDDEESNCISIKAKFLRSDSHFAEIRYNSDHLMLNK